MKWTRTLIPLAAVCAFASPAQAMECVTLMKWPDPFIARCLGEPPVQHPCNYWVGYGMKLYATSYGPTWPIIRVRCGAASTSYSRFVLWQPFITLRGKAVPLDSDIFHFNRGECDHYGSALP